MAGEVNTDIYKLLGGATGGATGGTSSASNPMGSLGGLLQLVQVLSSLRYLQQLQGDQLGGAQPMDPEETRKQIRQYLGLPDQNATPSDPNSGAKDLTQRDSLIHPSPASVWAMGAPRVDLGGDNSWLFPGNLAGLAPPAANFSQRFSGLPPGTALPDPNANLIPLLLGR